MRVLLSHSDNRPFEVARFGAAWRRAGGSPAELPAVTPSTVGVLPVEVETTQPRSGTRCEWPEGRARRLVNEQPIVLGSNDP